MRPTPSLNFQELMKKNQLQVIHELMQSEGQMMSLKPAVVQRKRSGRTEQNTVDNLDGEHRRTRTMGDQRHVHKAI